MTSSLNPRKRGLAIIVTCNYPNSEDYDPLEGADKDATRMREALQSFSFEIVLLQNERATEAGIKETLESISSSLSQYKDVQGKVIIFVFSGHGDSGNTIVSQDEKELSLQDDILPCIANENTLETPKLFFIDACRGEKYMQVKSKKFKGRSSEQQRLLDLQIGLQTNYRIDYATIEDYVAYADGTGSMWLAKVAEHLKDKKKKRSLQEIMAEVNKEVWQKVAHIKIEDENEKKKIPVKQQPHTEDRLNCGILYL